MGKKEEEKYLNDRKKDLLCSISFMALELSSTHSIEETKMLCITLQLKVINIIVIDNRLEELRKRRRWL